MGMVALRRGIGSAFVVSWGQYGDVSRFAQQQCVSRQYVYREAERVCRVLEGTQAQEESDHLRRENAELREQVAQLQQCLAVAVVLDDDKQAEFACAGQGSGVTLPQCHRLLEVLIPGRALSVATLGRRTQAAGEKSGALLEVLDAYTRPLVREGAADEIYVKNPVLMVVEQESLCWVCGRLSAEVSGQAWSEQFVLLPNLEQLARDGGTSLAKGVALENARRQEKGLGPIVEQGDHFHALYEGGAGVRRAELRTRQAFAQAQAKQGAADACARRGQSQQVEASRAHQAWKKAEKTMDAWQVTEQLWQQTKDALPLITPEGELNTRGEAETVLAQTLAQLPDSDFAKTKRALQRPEMLNHLDRVQEQLTALPFAPEITAAAVQHEALRRRPDLLQGDEPKAALLRGVLLACVVVLGKADDAGQQALAAVRDIFRRAYRASSLVECINSVLRMHQAQHRKLTQGMLDLKRLYWNCHTFRTGRRRRTTPYQRLGVPLPEGMRWWDLLKLTPEQLREKLSTAKKAA